jgi:hypothetical protein
MDPYLEAADLWPDVHTRLLNEFAGQIQPQVSPGYLARLEQYTFLTDPEGGSAVRLVPDVRVLGLDEDEIAVATKPAAVTAAAVEVTRMIGQFQTKRPLVLRDGQSRELITVIELLTPGSKRHGSNDRDVLLDKRDEVTTSSASWLEIDLLRGGEPSVLPDHRHQCTYAAYLDRTPRKDEEFRRQYFFPINLRQKLPSLPVPLRAGEPDVHLDLQIALTAAYDRACYDVDANYSAPPPPPDLAPEDAAWAAALLKPHKVS